MQDFDRYLQRKDLTESTRSGYKKSTIKFLQWYVSTGSTQADPINCTKKNILDYLAHLKNKGQAPTTRNHHLQSAKHYFDHLLDTDQIHKNPCNFIKIRGIKRKHLYHIFKSEELTQLADDHYNTFIRNFDDSRLPVNRIKPSELNRERNQIILGLLIYQGLKTGDISIITLDDLDLNKATIAIKGSGKSNSRKLALHASQIGSIIGYLNQIRPQFQAHYTQESGQLILLLPEHQGQKRDLSYNYNNIFLQLTHKLRSINSSFRSFKQVRASIITNWIKIEGLRKAQYMAGHRYISSTENYQVNDLESLTEDIAAHHPF